LVAKRCVQKYIWKEKNHATNWIWALDLLKVSQVLYELSHSFQRNVPQDLLLNAGNGKPKSRSIIRFPIIKYWHGLLQSSIANGSYEMINTVYNGSTINIKQVMSVRTIADALLQSKIYRDMLNEICNTVNAIFYLSCYFYNIQCWKSLFISLKGRNIFEK